MTFGEKLLGLRKSRGLSQEDLASLLGVSRQAISRWELGSATPDIPNLVKICRTFNITADYLINDDLNHPEKDPSSPGCEASPVSVQKNARHGITSLVIGIILTFLGGLGTLTICVLSSLIETRVKYHYIDKATGYTVYSSKPGYSLWSFIEQHNLGFLFALLLIILLCGIIILIIRSRNEGKQEKTGL